MRSYVNPRTGLNMNSRSTEKTKYDVFKKSLTSEGIQVKPDRLLCCKLHLSATLCGFDVSTLSRLNKPELGCPSPSMRSQVTTRSDGS